MNVRGGDAGLPARTLPRVLVVDTNLPGSCVGDISNAPDLELTCSAGSLPL